MIEAEFGKFYLEDGIVHCIYYQGITIDLKIVAKAIEHRITVSEGRSYPVLIDVRGVKYWTQDAKKYSMSSKGALNLISASALLVDSLPLKISVNWAIKFFPTEIPMKVFTNKEKALNWLEKYKTE
jgi:hypothetical protein